MTYEWEPRILKHPWGWDTAVERAKVSGGVGKNKVKMHKKQKMFCAYSNGKLVSESKNLSALASFLGLSRDSVDSALRRGYMAGGIYRIERVYID